MKWYRYGDPLYKHKPKFADLTGHRFGLLAAIERKQGRWICKCDCGEITVARSGDLNRGSITSCGASAHRHIDVPTYSGAHARVKALRGAASSHPCISCGNQAEHWSYNHDDTNEHHSTSDGSFGAPYSADPEHYSARCVSCHKNFDLGKQNFDLF